MDSRRFAFGATCLAVLVLTVCVFSGTLLLADDVEDPIDPTSAGVPRVAVGDTTVEPEDARGLAIDAKEAIEPLMTVSLTMD